MTPANRYDIVVVGAGLVGASLAAALGRSREHRELAIALVDAGKMPVPPPAGGFDPRVVALTRRSQALFTRLGIWSDIENPPAGQHRACPYTHMHVWDGEGTGRIDFDCRDLHQDNLGYIVENSLLINHLTASIDTLANVDQYRGDGVTAVEVGELSRVRLASGRILAAPLILAADGGNSHIRRLRQFPTREWHYGQRALVTTVKTERSHGFTAWQRFMASGPLAFLPLLAPDGDDHFSSIVWSLDEDRAGEIEALDDEAFKHALTKHFEARLGRITWVDKRFSFPLKQRHAKHYVEPGVALLGDAAHTIHPLAGQGVNLGLLDVEAMIAEIERALARRIPLADFSILRRYQRARLGPNLAMMSLMEGFKQLFGSRNAWLQVLRNTGMSRVDQIPVLRNAVANRAMGL